MESEFDIANYSSYIRKLLNLGFTEREAKIYLTLLTNRMATAIDLQGKVGVHRTKVYEVLQNMINRGICIEKRVGRTRIFEAVDPKIAFEMLIENYRNELKRKERIAEELTQVCMNYFNESKEIHNPLGFIEILKNRVQIHKMYVSVVESTKKELLTFNKGPYACDNPQRLKEQQIAEVKLINRGGICKNIYEKSEFQNLQWLVEYIKEQKQAGQLARMVDFLPIKMVISDGEKVMLPLEEESGQSGELVMCVIKHKAFGSACKMLFDYLWEKTKEINCRL
ncbi:MAG: TrmB family transcriptional regulator [Candidatus Jordarchaeum sp.]|uniref:TrmB family transcriptional regulator n=1 Tax=Candidatus Jordarchaeum sp. TaxID=2823881 RepID=UPI00404AA339